MPTDYVLTMNLVVIVLYCTLIMTGIDSTTTTKEYTVSDVLMFTWLILHPLLRSDTEVYEWTDDDFTPATYFSRDKIRANHNFILLMVYSAVE